MKITTISDTIWGRINTQALSYDGSDATKYQLMEISPNFETYAFSGTKAETLLKDITVLGVLLNEVTYQYSSEWEASTDFIKLFSFGLAAKLNEMGGGGESGAVFKSKKVWRRCGYVEISPKIRIIDVDGNGLALRVVKDLQSLTIPAGAWSLLTDSQIEQMYKTSHNFIDGTINLAERITKFLGGVFSKEPQGDTPPAETGNTTPPQKPNIGDDTSQAVFDKNIESILSSFAKNAFKYHLNGLFEDYTAVRFSPPPLRVRVAGVFDHNDMVLTSVGYTFSKEATKMGPIYVDIDLTMTSRQRVDTLDNSTLSPDGLVTNRMGRVFKEGKIEKPTNAK